MANSSNSKRGLGRGLSALMNNMPSPADVSGDPAKAGEQSVPIEDVAPNPNQPRRRFEKSALDDLAASIAEKGIIQPIIVRPLDRAGAKYEIVAGERRWRAAQLAKLHNVPVVVRGFSDEEAMEVAIIENIQRDDLNAIEEAEGYQSLMKQHGRTQEELASALGKSRSHIANMLRLLQLPSEVQDFLIEGKLSAGHARALITSEDPASLARIVVSKGLSVRDTEKLTKKPSTPKKVTQVSTKDADTRALENELSASVGSSVTIDQDGTGEGGKITIKYKSLEDLDDLCRRLSNVGAGSI